MSGNANKMEFSLNHLEKFSWVLMLENHKTIHKKRSQIHYWSLVESCHLNPD